MTILDQIVEYKRSKEIPRRKREVALATLRAEAAQAPPGRDFAGALLGVSRSHQGQRVALIAEVKKASPSKGLLRANFDPVALAWAYAQNGAAAISVVTDTHYFQGRLEFLTRIRDSLELGDSRPETGAVETDGSGTLVVGSPSPPLAGQSLPVELSAGPGRSWPQAPPLLRKDFIVDPYQVYESRAAGADALLLIAAILSQAELAELLALTHDLGMTALVEVHDEPDLERVLPLEPRLLGVNNRDLRDFSVDLNSCLRLRPRVPPATCFVAESGIQTRADVARLAGAGVDAILVGEALVRAGDVAAKVRELAGSEVGVWSG
jgi:indole-3-glycerol phosphate synthase